MSLKWVSRNNHTATLKVLIQHFHMPCLPQNSIISQSLDIFWATKVKCYFFIRCWQLLVLVSSLFVFIKYNINDWFACRITPLLYHFISMPLFLKIYTVVSLDSVTLTTVPVYYVIESGVCGVSSRIPFTIDRTTGKGNYFSTCCSNTVWCSASNIVN